MNESTWEVYFVSQYRPVAKKVTLITLSSAFLLAAVLLTACTRPASKPSVVYATSSAPRVTVDRVQINQGTGIFVSGRSTLPDGECVKTELRIDKEKAGWWPQDICVAVDTGQWEMLVGLGSKSAPDQLEPGKDYEIHAWWPKNPEQVTTRFPFNLDGPKQ
jgi:hypothetical protein